VNMSGATRDDVCHRSPQGNRLLMRRRHRLNR
jgi:hypothetical protein